MEESELSNGSRSRSVSPNSPSSSDEEISNVRRRGRGRGRQPRATGVLRGRGRGMCRGRQRVQPAGLNRLEMAAQARRDRQSQLEECISNMDLAALQETLKLVCKKQPSLLMDVLKTANDNGDPTPGNSPAVPDWCSCNNCREMPTEREKLCCGKVPQNCHTKLADFYTIVLDELVLEVAMRFRNDALAEPRDDNYNRAHRHTAYRQYVMWMHGRLGAGNRKVIPSCCIWKIRDQYPEPSGQYVGYIEGVLD